MLADIHSNLEALNAVLKEAEKYHFKRILCLGDIVGYGANPNECINILKRNDAISLLGNHDAAVCGMIGTEWFNPEAAACIEWTKQRLSEENFTHLSSLPKFFSMKFLLAVHGTPLGPLLQYINFASAQKTLDTVPESLVLVGHTHTPCLFTKQNERHLKENTSVAFHGKRMVASLPSVGQPRDHNPRAGFAILNFEREELLIKRVEYDIESAARKIREAGLPETEAERLFHGI